MTKLLIRLFIRDPANIQDRTVRTAYGNLACMVGIVCNVLLFAGKFTVGTLFGSMAIAADALNNLSDASSNVVSLVGFRLGSKPADDEHPYGHARYEYLAGLAVSVMILVIGIELLKESFLKVLHPTPVTLSALTIAVLVVCAMCCCLRASLRWHPVWQYGHCGGRIEQSVRCKLQRGQPGGLPPGVKTCR